MKFIPNAVAAKLARQALVSQKNSPAVLFGAGVAGMVATTVLACRATLKVEEVLEETNSKLEDIQKVLESNNPKYSETDAKKDKAYVYIRAAVGIGRLYGPAILCGVASVSALAGAQQILVKRNAALTAAYAVVDRSFKDYRKRIADRYGEDQEREIYHNLEACEIEDETSGKTKTVKRANPRNGYSMYARLFDNRSKSWSPTPEYNVVFLRSQQNYCNDLLKSRGHLFLNEVYDMLGIERSTEGAVVGWVYNGDGDNYVDFGIFSTDLNDRVLDFMCGREGAIWLDFNVDGVVYDKI